MALSRSERISRRDIVCRPPRYPGNPKDYQYVEEHCRKAGPKPGSDINASMRLWKKQAEKDFKKAEMRLPQIPSTGVPAIDELLSNSISIQKLIPEYINHMFGAFIDPKMIKNHPQPDSRWNAARKSWRFKAPPDQPRLKVIIANMAQKHFLSV